MTPESPFEEPQVKQEVIRHAQQSVEPELGEYKALRSCAPTSMYMLAEAHGYIDKVTGPTLTEFVKGLDWDKDFQEGRGWLRANLSRHLREEYGVPVVSWITSRAENPSDEDIASMHKAGYLSSDVEEKFFKEHIVGHSLAEIINEGYPIVAGVKPGFGENKRAHAVVITKWEDGKVEVLDPDQRNIETTFDEDYVQEYLNPDGGCSVILPKDHTEAD